MLNKSGTREVCFVSLFTRLVIIDPGQNLNASGIESIAHASGSAKEIYGLKI